MLSNPHWNAPSLSSFESWLETKDPSQTYPYSDCRNCACAQYLQAIGKFDEKWLSKSHHGDTMYTLNMLAAGDQFSGESPDYTFGKLLERVRKARQFAVV